MDLVKDLNERILGDFLGVFATTEEFVAGIEDESFVASQKFAIGCEIIRELFLTTRDEFSVGQFFHSLLVKGGLLVQGVYHEEETNECIVNAMSLQFSVPKEG